MKSSKFFNILIRTITFLTVDTNTSNKQFDKGEQKILINLIYFKYTARSG